MSSLFILAQVLITVLSLVIVGSLFTDEIELEEINLKNLKK